MKSISQADSLEEVPQKGNNHFIQANSLIEFIEFEGEQHQSAKERRRHIYSEELKTPKVERRR